MKIAIYQNSPVFGEIDQNIKDVFKSTINEDFDILVLPELFATGYQFQNREEAVSMADEFGKGTTFNKMRQLAEKKNALIVYGFPEKKGKKLFNSAVAVDSDGKSFLYQKTHLFDTEKNIFDPGESGFSVFEYKKAKIGMMICYDWRYPESARKLAVLGAQIICHPANLVLTTCPDAMITRALENMVYTVTVDRVGEENRFGQMLKFRGKSRIISPKGKILAELGEVNPGLISVEIDPQDADNKSVTPNNHLFDDFRPEFY
ncbi:MAG: beta-ureidopropionase [candidate division Zixibacteria bacterium]|nr:beta-ureidopropionase [candidate division Zixibacteria bacterium]